MWFFQIGFTHNTSNWYLERHFLDFWIIKIKTNYGIRKFILRHTMLAVLANARRAVDPLLQLIISTSCIINRGFSNIVSSYHRSSPSYSRCLHQRWWNMIWKAWRPPHHYVIEEVKEIDVIDRMNSFRVWSGIYENKSPFLKRRHVWDHDPQAELTFIHLAIKSNICSFCKMWCRKIKRDGAKINRSLSTFI